MLGHNGAARRAIASCLLVLICGFASTADDASQWPKGYSLVTVQSGRTYKVLNSGPVTGKAGKRLGMGVWYISDARDFEELKAGRRISLSTSTRSRNSSTTGRSS